MNTEQRQQIIFAARTAVEVGGIAARAAVHARVASRAVPARYRAVALAVVFVSSAAVQAIARFGDEGDR